MNEERVLKQALGILEKRMYASECLTSPYAVRDYLRVLLASREHEVFVVIFLDAQNRVLASEEMFRGSLAQTSVYPREVLKSALKHNAGAVIFSHCHPSGFAEPSRADELLTQTLKQVLAYVDIRVLDHFIIGGTTITSMAERGLI
jgi:DNA repair protein RadC